MTQPFGELELGWLTALRKDAALEGLDPADEAFLPVVGPGYGDEPERVLVVAEALPAGRPGDTPLWRFARALQARLVGGPPVAAGGFPDALAVSAVLKLGARDGSPPAGRLAQRQAAVCGRLLDRELEVLQPRVVVFLHPSRPPCNDLVDGVVFCGRPRGWVRGFADGGSVAVEHFLDEARGRHCFWAYHPRRQGPAELSDAVLDFIQARARR